MNLAKRLRMRDKLLLLVSSFLVLIFIVILVVLQVITTVYTSNYVKDNVYVRQEKCDQALNSLFVDTNSSLITLFSNENINAIESSEKKNETISNIYNRMSFSSNVYIGVSYYNDGELIAETCELPVIDTIYQEQVRLSEQYLVFVRTILKDGNNVLVFGKSNTNGSLSFAYLQEKVIVNFLNNILATGYSFIVSNDNYIVSYPSGNYSGSYIFDQNTYNISAGQNYSIRRIEGEKCLVAVGETPLIYRSFGMNWKVVSVVPYNDLFSLFDIFRIVLLIITFLILIISFVISILVSKSVTKPITQLAYKVDQFDINHPIIRDKKRLKKTNDEIYKLEESYNAMISRIYNLMDKNIKDMEEKRILELDSLQQQINPHFLYNTLDAIAWMAKIKKEPEIEKLVMSLAKFFRISLHRGDKIITIGEEVELTQHYLEIEEIRFPQRFKIEYDVDEDVKDYKTLKLILQPIVENAIKYGMSENSGTIYISVKKFGNEIIMVVRDDGQGFEVPSSILHMPLASGKETKSGFGLFNVNERIRLEYGEEYGLKISSSPHQGTKVVINIPAKV